MIFGKNDTLDIENAVDRYLYSEYDADCFEDGEAFSDLRHKDNETHNITF